LALGALTGVQGEADAAVDFELPTMPVAGYAVANEVPASGFSQLVSTLRYRPVVELQSRGPAEGQADVTVRGSIFEHTGFKLGALHLYDAQTGHYAGEVPLDPGMLTAVVVRTGTAHALGGFNANAGSLVYGFAPVVARGRAELGAGNNALVTGSFYQGMELRAGGDGRVRVALDFSAAYSESDGTVAFGDHEFARYAGRLQFAGERWQTDVFGGYLSKFYGWPGMYTGFASLKETDDYQVSLIGVNHRMRYGDGSHIEAGAYFRRLVDDYEFNRALPPAGLFDHTFEVWEAALEGRHGLGGDLSLNWAANVLGDHTVRSTSLFHGNYGSRSYGRVAAMAEKRVGRGLHSEWVLAGGAGVDDSNRSGAKVSPLARVEWRMHRDGVHCVWYADLSQTTQLPGYTALNSSAAGTGLFRGNPDLGRETTQVVELGHERVWGNWSAHAAVFFRDDADLVDWTFSESSPNNRQANPVDIETLGFEGTLGYGRGPLRLSASYAFLEKDADYGSADVDASYYALNFPGHRVTISGTGRIVEGLVLRIDAEYREQEPNARRGSDEEAFRMRVGIDWQPQFAPALGFTLSVDNLTRSNFEPFPGTPGEGRQITLRANCAW